MPGVYQVPARGGDSLGSAMQLFNTIRSFKGGGSQPDAPDTSPKPDAGGGQPEATAPLPQTNQGAMGDYPGANVYQRRIQRSY